MKFRNKSTGEIGRLASNTARELRIINRSGKTLGNYKTLDALCKDWEDASKKPSKYWYIDDYGHIGECPVICFATNGREAIGNYFESKNEAEKAVEKLKALKRMNEAGLKIEAENVSDIDSIKDGYIDFDLHCYFKRYDGFGEDMDTLFGGEEFYNPKTEEWEDAD